MRQSLFYSKHNPFEIDIDQIERGEEPAFFTEFETFAMTKFQQQGNFQHTIRLKRRSM